GKVSRLEGGESVWIGRGVKVSGLEGGGVKVSGLEEGESVRTGRGGEILEMIMEGGDKRSREKKVLGGAERMVWVIY
ncbi:unnamed protein product, partial [Staurois parvus]